MTGGDIDETIRRRGRRRFIQLTAAAAGALLLPFHAARAEGLLHVWTGVALGADACLRLYHPDRVEAERLINLCVDEIGRLERIFSLYRSDSALVRLNRDGVIENPPADLVRLMAESIRIGTLTERAFDVSVEPLWQLYAEHFARPGADPAGPSDESIRAVRSLVGFHDIEVASDRIAFGRGGMAVTLNGIAQGYATDRVADLLRAHGVDRVLVDMGEIFAVGTHPDGAGWRVGLKDPVDRRSIVRTLEITDLAASTSGAYGTVFEPTGRFHHLIDPQSGLCADRYSSMTVTAANATTSDGLSTAFTMLSPERIAAVLQSFPGARAYATDRNRVIQVIDA